MNHSEFDRYQRDEDKEAAQADGEEWGKVRTEISALAACWGLLKLIWEFLNYLIVRFLYLILRALWLMFRPRKPITVDKSPTTRPLREQR